MLKTNSAAGTQGRAAGPIEPNAIVLIGGPLNGKKVADTGQTKGETPEGDLYLRVRMEADGVSGRLSFDVLAYWGKTWNDSAA